MAKEVQVLVVEDGVGEEAAPQTSAAAALLADSDLRLRILPFPEVEAVRRTLRPELVLLDLGDLPGDEAVRRTALLSRTWPRVPLVTYGSQRGTDLLAILAAGAADHVTPHADGDEMRARLLAAQERKLTEWELRRGYARFQNLFRAADVGIALANAQGHFLEANPAFYELLGYTPETLPLCSVEDLTHPEDRRFLHLFWELAAARRDHYEVRKRYLRADGRVIWLEVHASRIQDASAGERCLIAEFHDLTPYLRTREALDETREQYRILFERNPVPTLVVDPGPSLILAANQATLDTYGYRLRDMLDMPLRRLWYSDEDLPADLGIRLQNDTAKRPIRARHRRQDGTPLEVEVHSAELEYDHRPALLLLVRNVTPSLHLPGEQAAPPARSAAGAVTASDAASETPAARSVSILLLDDDDAVRFLMREMLSTVGHRVMDFASAGAARQGVAEHAADFDLVIADATLEDLASSALLDFLRAANPDLRLLLVSGYLDDILATRGALGGEPPFLSKPFSAEELLSKVAESLGTDGAG